MGKMTQLIICVDRVALVKKLDNIASVGMTEAHVAPIEDVSQ
jgi:hypothetical protein